jgi:LuxR family maltose regulon positive regulatory protein
MARRHDVWHYALWSMIQQSEILFAQGFLQAAWEFRKAFQLIREQHLEQLPMHEFLLRIALSCCGPGRGWMKRKPPPAGHGCPPPYQPQQQLQCLALRCMQCSLARGDLDNARSHLNRLENLLGNGHYHSDWVSNAESPGDLLADDRR